MTQTINKKKSLRGFYKSLKNFISKCFQLIFAFVIFAFACLALSKFAYEKLYVNYFFDNVNQLEFLISFTLASFFPISAIAYLLFQRDTQRRKLARGFWFLGINVRGDLDVDDLERIEAHLAERQQRNEGRNLERNINLVIDSEDTSSLDWDVEAYGEYFNIFDSRSNIALNYVAQSIPTILATMLGLSLFISNQGNRWIDLEILNSIPIPINAMQFGFLGAYIFSIQLVYRRYTTFDLQPIVYMYCTLTMIAGIVFNFVAFQAINTLNGTHEVSGLTGGILPIVAFSLGYFPYLAIRWFNRVGYTALGLQQRRSNALPLGLIDGISQFHETRLRDEGIDNVQNLASAALDDLLINTRFSAPEVIAWVDQAILYLYLESNEIEIFRRGGIRCFTDLQDYWGPYFKAYHTVGKPTRKLIETLRHPEQSFSGLKESDVLKLSQRLYKQWVKDRQLDTDKATNKVHENLEKDLEEDRKSLALQLKTTPDALDALYLATKWGPNVSHIKHYWKIEEDIANTTRKTRVEIHIRNFLKDLGRYQKYKDIFKLPELTALWNDYQRSLEDYEWSNEEEEINFLIGKARIADVFDQGEEAIKAYEKAIAIAPNSSKPRNMLAWFYYQKNRDLQQALKLAEKAVDIAKAQKEDKHDLHAALDTLASIKILLVDKEKDPERRKELINGANKLLDKITKEELLDYELNFVNAHRKTLEKLQQQKIEQPQSS